MPHPAVLGDLATLLAQHWRSGTRMRLLPSAALPRNRTEAYWVQDQMADALAEPISGWKVGATSARMRELDGHDDVIPGRIFQSVTWIGTDHELPISRFDHARVETEFAFRLDADLPLRDTPWLADEVAPRLTLCPAIEIIGNRFTLDTSDRGLASLMTIADNGGGIGFVFGDPVTDWQRIDFQRHVIKLSVDGGTAADNFLGEMRCIPLDAVVDLVNHLASRGYALERGQFVSTGAATVPQPIHAGSHVIADFGFIGRLQLLFDGAS